MGNAAYKEALIRESSVSAWVPRTWETSPAACHVVPPVRRTRSNTRTSVTPSLVRWYAIDEPMIPPPTITTRARAGGSETGSRIELSRSRFARCSGTVMVPKDSDMA